MFDAAQHQKDVAEATKLFMTSRAWKDGDPTIFLTMTQKEGVFVHLVSLIAVGAMRDSYQGMVNDPTVDSTAVEVCGSLLVDAITTEMTLWDKILGAIAVQVLDKDPGYRGEGI